jgi:phage N-6-adenine-methyltransferase
MKDLTLFFPPRIHDSNSWLRPGLMSSDEVEWYTPPVIRDAVVRALGGKVDLDPCADPGRSFPAAEHFTEEDNGLARPWIGRVYMNPPYGRTISAWTTKLADEIRAGWATAAVALLPARVDTAWWHDLNPQVVCFIRGRLRFSGYEQSAPFPSAAVYFGPDEARFMRAFTELGLFYVATALDS